VDYPAFFQTGKPYVWTLTPPEQMSKFYAFYGISPDHPLSLQFQHSGLAGSYFLGRCRVTNSLLYKSDIRGDELKASGDAANVRYNTVGGNVQMTKNTLTKLSLLSNRVDGDMQAWTAQGRPVEKP